MHLKSLTLKGFKSFASATTLRFEPGITCVVGSNGSGKSNVVDALTWVMGEQGAKALRGGKMEDVIFAGTAGRAPLGRAEVTLTIDNSDGALPIDYAEVAITRRMFRDGASEYELNGRGCRLLDVQELLSDSGIGREMHVVVGQGRLAGILEARPEDRRAFIEEAAGVLKHRKRKEKAVRKLEAMSANLARLSDLTTELRRQLKPLGRQAEVARRAQTVQADLRDARLRLVADDLVTARRELALGTAEESAGRAEREQVQARHAEVAAALAAVDADLREVVPRVEQAQRSWFALTGLAERLGSTVAVAAERHRNLTDPGTAPPAGPDPDALEAQATESAEAEAALAADVDAHRGVLGAAQTRRGELERSLAAADRAHLAAVRAVADRREGLARLTGQVETMRSRVDSRTAELNQLTESIDAANARAESEQDVLDEVSVQVAHLDAGELGLDAHHEQASAQREAASVRVAERESAERALAQEIASGRARTDALRTGLSRGDGSAWLLANAADGVLGATAHLVAVEPGFETAVAAALGAAADALVVDGVDAALSALRALKHGDGGRAGLVVTGGPPPPPSPAPGSGRWAHEVITCTDGVRPTLETMLEGVVVVDDLDEARAALGRPRDDGAQVRAVTRDGDLLGHGWAVGGSDRAPSTLEVQAAVDDAVRHLLRAEESHARVVDELASARAVAVDAGKVVERTLDALNASDAELAAVSERLATLGQSIRSAHEHARQLGVRRDEAVQRRTREEAELAELVARLGLAEQAPGEHEPDTGERDGAARELEGSRAAEVEARLELRTAEERAGARRGRATELRRRAAAEREARERGAHAARVRAASAAVASAVMVGARRARARAEELIAAAAADRDRLGALQAAAVEEQGRLREESGVLGARLAALTDAVHRDEVAAALAASRAEALEAAVGEQWGLAPEDLIAEFGPEVGLAPSPQEIAEYELALERGELVLAPVPARYDRAAQERRARSAEKDLALLGRVNPLALEEFAALEERHQFLATQLQDVLDARRALLGVVSDVDAKILEVFTTAFHDVAAEFGAVFETLFPGGEGRLELTDPADMLSTGIEVHARPPGKRLKRLSLLSGGEKSLTAVAMLVAIFRARPSPFYVMDEVEAALDETNLRRLITLFDQLRERSQLIVITHQKATMEVADALYGVSMQGDGITTVISQRMGRASARAG